MLRKRLHFIVRAFFNARHLAALAGAYTNAITDTNTITHTDTIVALAKNLRVTQFCNLA